MDFNDQIDRTAALLKLDEAIDAYSRTTLQDEPREHLGASVIGEPCQAKIWNDFRWLKQPNFNGRMLRLFERGKLEEARFVEILRGVGFDVREFEGTEATDDKGNVKFKQFRISGCNGHFGGSLDGMAMPPEWFFNEPLLLEFKTHNAKSFAKLVKEGVKLAKPQHYAQMCCYGRAYNLRFGLYCAVNKDTDELRFEIVPIDYIHADFMFQKAETIINAQEQPAKIAQTETYYQCKGCAHVGVCHRGEKPDKNCRSCVWAKPVENGQWNCDNEKTSAVEGFCMNKSRISRGCDNWQPIIND